MLKALGYLPNVSLADLDRDSTKRLAATASFDPAERLCLHPDYPDNELATVDPDYIATSLAISPLDGKCIHLAHKGMQEATGSGSWGICVPSLYPNNNAVRYYVDVDSFSANHRETVSDEDLRLIARYPVWSLTSEEEILDRFSGKSKLDVAFWLGVEETYRRVGCAHVRTDNHDEAGIHVLSRVIPGSTIGIGWFPSAGCGSHVEFHIDSSWRADLHNLAWLFGHECGHCNKLPHTFSGQERHHGVMSYSKYLPYVGYSTGEDPFPIPRDPSMSQLTRQYGGEPIPVEPPQPPTEPPMGKFWQCLISVLPAFLACLFEQEQAARAKGEAGPLQELSDLASSVKKKE